MTKPIETAWRSGRAEPSRCGQAYPALCNRFERRDIHCHVDRYGGHARPRTWGAHVNRDDALRKLRALLSLTRARGASEQEAETALRQARKLMDQFEIDERDVIEADLGSDDAIVVGEVPIDLVTADHSSMATAVGRLFDCHTSLERRSDGGGVYRYYGYGPDVQVACWMYRYLVECAVQHAASYAETLIAHRFASEDEPSAVKRAMAAYHRGFLRRLSGRVSALKQERDGGIAPTIQALMVHKESAIERKFGKFKYTRTQYADPADLQSHLWRGASDAEGVDLSVRGIGQDSESSDAVRGGPDPGG